jgi:hypothetical protein
MSLNPSSEAGSEAPVPEIEPYAGEPEADEVMAGGGLPRWFGLLAVLLLVVVVVAIVRKHGTPHTGGALPRPSAIPIPTQPPRDVAYDLASGPLGTWLLETGELAQVSGTRVTHSVSLRGVAFPDRSVPILAVDPDAPRIWVVLTNAAPSRMIEFDATTLQRLRDVRWPVLVQRAVALRGHLYVSTDFGVADLGPNAARPHFVPGLAGALGPVTLDPTRHRLIVTDFGYPTDVWTYSPGTFATQSPYQLPYVRGSVAVVDGRIWVGGWGLRRAELEQLDPKTLRPVLHAPARGLGAGLTILGHGSRVLWVRLDTDGDALACIDGVTGRIEQTWQLAAVNAVTSSRAGALVATPTGVLGLIMSGCAG